MAYNGSQQQLQRAQFGGIPQPMQTIYPTVDTRQVHAGG
jgi:hypothetical protein